MGKYDYNFSNENAAAFYYYMKFPKEERDIFKNAKLGQRLNKDNVLNIDYVTYKYPFKFTDIIDLLTVDELCELILKFGVKEEVERIITSKG